MKKAKLYIDNEEFGTLEFTNHEFKYEELTIYSNNNYSLDYILDRGIAKFEIKLNKKHSLFFNATIEKVSKARNWNEIENIYTISISNKEMIDA